MGNGAYFTIGQAAKETNRAKSTIKRAIDTGELSVSEKTARGFKINAAELFRVFPKRTENAPITQTETTINLIENSVLQAKLEASQQRYQDAEETIDDLRGRLSKSDNERTRLTTLLTDQRGEKHTEPRKGILARLIGA